MRRKRIRRHLLIVECEGLRELFYGRIRLKGSSLLSYGPGCKGPAPVL